MDRRTPRRTANSISKEKPGRYRRGTRPGRSVGVLLASWTEGSNLRLEKRPRSLLLPLSGKFSRAIYLALASARLSNELAALLRGLFCNLLQAGAIRDDYPEYSVGYQADSPADPKDRVSARLGAIGALNRLHSDGSAPPRAAMHSTLLPRGGVDGTLPQWVNITAVELWMPVEKVMEAYRWMQQTMMAEPDPPKTQARAFNVARFVWEQEKQYGERPPWPIMCERWNNYPLARAFKS